MGLPKKNDINIYDDAIILISPTAWITYNANTDPSKIYPRVATLKSGIKYLYRVGIHNISKPARFRYKALVQADEVHVERFVEYNNGRPVLELDHGYFGINIHKGSMFTTSSAGCQTIYPEQWVGFINSVQSEMKRYGQRTIPYLLVEEDELK